MTTWTLDEHGPVALLTFTRPPRNVMDFAPMAELREQSTDDEET